MDLNRFVDAQADIYEQALGELRSGRKRSHWMWFIFPQVAGLGLSAMSQRYALSGRAEAMAYLQHPVLGPRLIECCSALLAIQEKSALDILGSPDDMKLRSCATLFAADAPANSVFHQVIDRFFDGQPDPATLERIK
jgi:uncharacterized protein (DUF1810 family)